MCTYICIYIYIYVCVCKITYNACLGGVDSLDHSYQFEAGRALLPTWLARLCAARCTLLASAPTTRGTTSTHALGDCCGGCWWLLGGRNFQKSSMDFPQKTWGEIGI